MEDVTAGCSFHVNWKMPDPDCSGLKQQKIELFARNNYFGWDNWGLKIPESKIEIKCSGDKKETVPFLEKDTLFSACNQ